MSAKAARKARERRDKRRQRFDRIKPQGRKGFRRPGSTNRKKQLG